jgi:hypothetical protein
MLRMSLYKSKNSVIPPLTFKDFPNLRQWYRSTDVIKDGSDMVDQYTDLSGNGHHFTANGTDRYKWFGNVLDGKPSIRAINGTEKMRTPSYLPYTNSQTFFIVCKNNSGYFPTFSESTGYYFLIFAAGNWYLRDGAYINWGDSFSGNKIISSIADATGIEVFDNNISLGRQNFLFNLSLGWIGNVAFTLCYHDIFEMAVYDRQLDKTTEHDRIINEILKVEYPSII